MSTQQTPDLTYVTIEGANSSATESALYKREPNSGNWDLVTVEEGERKSTVLTMQALGAGYRATRVITHLRRGGTWQQTVPDYLMVETTPVQKIETEIADLRAEAHRRHENAGYSGSYGDDGASLLEARADAMQHVLDVLAATDDD